MGEPSLLDKLRYWIGGIAFDIFLWCNRMTAEQYQDLLDIERGLMARAQMQSYDRSAASRKVTQMNLTEEQTKSLADFALAMLENYPELDGVDPWDIQELAEKHKILVPHTVYAPCGEGCNCIEYYDTESWQKGVTCYRFADWLDTARGLTLHEAKSGSGQVDAQIVTRPLKCKECGHEHSDFWSNDHCHSCGALLDEADAGETTK